jgi:flagellar biosynthetic protein FliQ
MTPEAAIDILKEVIVFSLFVCSPFLIGLLVVGLITSIFQSATSIQEQTLTFGPKLIAGGVLFVLLAPWLVRVMSEFTISCFARMASLGN